jgi:hypothetical protein
MGCCWLRFSLARERLNRFIAKLHSIVGIIELYARGNKIIPIYVMIFCLMPWLKALWEKCQDGSLKGGSGDHQADNLFKRLFIEQLYSDKTAVAPSI